MQMHIMIDIETLDTQPSAVVPAIALVAFHIEHLGMKDPPGGLVNEVNPFGLNLCLYPDVMEQLLMGRTTSESTLKFWREQSPEAKDAVLNDAQRMTVAHTRRIISDWIAGIIAMEGVTLEGVWGNGSNFDNVILRSFMDSNAWHPKLDRCYRTLRKLPGMPDEPEFDGIKHHALDDAFNQAKHAVTLLRHLQQAV